MERAAVREGFCLRSCITRPGRNQPRIARRSKAHDSLGRFLEDAQLLTEQRLRFKAFFPISRFYLKTLAAYVVQLLGPQIC
jgi:hypothetical protein